MSGEVRIALDTDIVVVRKRVREAASEIGFGATDVTRIVTSASELARNVVIYAGSGSMRWRVVQAGGKVGIELTFEDRGPGIADVALAMTPGFSTGRGLGMGISGAKRLMGELEIRTRPGEGTVIVVRKWRGRA